MYCKDSANAVVTQAFMNGVTLTYGVIIYRITVLHLILYEYDIVICMLTTFTQNQTGRHTCN